MNYSTSRIQNNLLEADGQLKKTDSKFLGANDEILQKHQSHRPLAPNYSDLSVVSKSGA